MAKADDIMGERGFLTSADMLQFHPEALKEIMEDANGKKERFIKENLSGLRWVNQILKLF